MHTWHVSTQQCFSVFLPSQSGLTSRFYPFQHYSGFVLKPRTALTNCRSFQGLLIQIKVLGGKKQKQAFAIQPLRGSGPVVGPLTRRMKVGLGPSVWAGLLERCLHSKHCRCFSKCYLFIYLQNKVILKIYNLTFIHLSQVPKSRPSRHPVPGKFSLSLHSHQRGFFFTVSQAVFPFQFLAK